MKKAKKIFFLQCIFIFYYSFTLFKISIAKNSIDNLKELSSKITKIINNSCKPSSAEKQEFVFDLLVIYFFLWKKQPSEKKVFYAFTFFSLSRLRTMLNTMKNQDCFDALQGMIYHYENNNNTANADNFYAESQNMVCSRIPSTAKKKFVYKDDKNTYLLTPDSTKKDQIECTKVIFSYNISADTAPPSKEVVTISNFADSESAKRKKYFLTGNNFNNLSFKEISSKNDLTSDYFSSIKITKKNALDFFLKGKFYQLHEGGWTLKDYKNNLACKALFALLNEVNPLLDQPNKKRFIPLLECNHLDHPTQNDSKSGKPSDNEDKKPEDNNDDENNNFKKNNFRNNSHGRIELSFPIRLALVTGGTKTVLKSVLLPMSLDPIDDNSSDDNSWSREKNPFFSNYYSSLKLLSK